MHRTLRLPLSLLALARLTQLFDTERAAWTVVANVLLNLDEAITKG